MEEAEAPMRNLGKHSQRWQLGPITCDHSNKQGLLPSRNPLPHGVRVNPSEVDRAPAVPVLGDEAPGPFLLGSWLPLPSSALLGLQ